MSAVLIACSPGFQARSLKKPFSEAQDFGKPAAEETPTPSKVPYSEPMLPASPQFKMPPPRHPNDPPSIDQPPDEAPPETDFPNPEEPALPSTPPVPPQGPPPAAREFPALVKCEKTERGFCPASVGLLIVRTATWQGQCTTALIGEDLAITNSHCLPSAIRSAGADCRRSLNLYFPRAEDHAQEQAACERVLYAAKLTTEGQPHFGLEADYAILKLARKLKRPMLPVSRAGVSDGLKLAAFVVDPVEPNTAEPHLRGVLRVKKCIARQGSAVAPSFVHPFAPVASVSSCEIIHGNSGAPAIDREGRLRALVHASLHSQPRVASSGLDENQETSSFARMALLTNLACTEIPPEGAGNSGKVHADCQKRQSWDEHVKSAHLSSDEKDLRPLGEAWLKSAPHEFKFEVRRSEHEQSSIRLLAPQIICVKDAKALTTRQAQHAKLEMKITLPFWGYKADLDEYYRVSLRPEVLDEVELNLSFDAKTLAKQGSVAVQAITKGRNSQQTQNLSGFGLQLCR